jgi:CIC family chloride channel protein
VLGGVLLALPEMYGVGYPVMDKVISGHVVLWLVLVLLVAKPLTASLTIGIGGSGGMFAPSLFTGAMAGAAFGMVAHHLFGSVAGPLGLYAVVAMGAVFGAVPKRRSPLSRALSR